MVRIKPLKAFRHLTENEIVDDLQGEFRLVHPLADEVLRLAGAYLEATTREIERLGRIPEPLINVAPRWPIEIVAVRQAKFMLAQMLGLKEEGGAAWAEMEARFEPKH